MHLLLLGLLWEYGDGKSGYIPATASLGSGDLTDLSKAWHRTPGRPGAQRLGKNGPTSVTQV